MTTLDWSLIDKAAERLGVSEASRKKWRQRGVPHKWRIPIIEKTDGQISSKDFKAADRERVA